MKRFLITSDKFTGTAELMYNERGTLIKIDMTQAQMCENTVVGFKRAVPQNLPLLIRNDWCSPGTTVVEADFEVTFEMFWNAYRLKVNKKRCTPLWDKLSKPKQVAAFYGISRYDKFLHKTGRYKLDPENYLRNETWENEYR